MAYETLNKCIGCSSDEIQSVPGTEGFSKCGRCGLIFDNPRPSAVAIREFYSREGQYDGWLDEIAERDDLWNRRLKKIMAIPTHRGALLDVGAGIGQFLHHASQVFEDVTGTEISSSAIDIAKKRYGLNLVDGNLEDTFFLEKRFNIITAFHVLEHVPFPGKFLDKCLSLLEEGGVLILAVPNDVDSFWARLRRIFRIFGSKKYSKYTSLGLPMLTLDDSTEEVHLSHFTKKSLSTLLSDRGFEVEHLSLDPFFVSKGSRLFRHKLIYRICGLIDLFSGINLYETLWAVARKPAT